MRPSISVVIPSRVGDSHLRLVVSKVLEQVGVDFEVIVVFNPCLPSWHYPGVKVLSSPLGANWARNEGLKAARHDLIYFLDSDCLLENQSALARVVYYFASNLDWAAVGGGYSLPEHFDRTTRAYNYIQNHWLALNIQSSSGLTPFLIGGNMAIRKSKISGLEFDANMIFGGTELDFFCRLQKITNQVYFKSDLNVQHLCVVNRAQLAEKARSQAAGGLYIEKKGVKYTPQKRSVFVKPPANDLAKDIDFYHQVYNDYRLSGGSINRLWHGRFQFWLSKVIDRLDLTIQNAKRIQSKSP